MYDEWLCKWKMIFNWKANELLYFTRFFNQQWIVLPLHVLSAAHRFDVGSPTHLPLLSIPVAVSFHKGFSRGCTILIITWHVSHHSGGRCWWMMMAGTRNKVSRFSRTFWQRKRPIITILIKYKLFKDQVLKITWIILGDTIQGSCAG